ASHQLAHAAFAVLGANMLLEAVIDQRVEILDRFGIDVAAASAIAAPRAAILDELLTAKRDAAVSARAAGNINLRLIEELHAAAFRARENWRRMMGRCATCAATVSNPAFSKLDATPV